jgi:hypothetical protein
MEHTKAKELREEADYLEWLEDPIIKLTKLLHDLFCKHNHTDRCSFKYEEGWKKRINTTDEIRSSHAVWYKKAFAIHTILNGTALKIAEKIEDYPFECEAGNLKTCIDWQTLKTFLENGKI